MSLCMHTCVHVCVCVCAHTARVHSWAAQPGVRGFVPLSQEGAAEGRTWCQAGAGLGQPGQRVLRPSVWSFTQAKVLLSHRAALIPALDPECQVSGPIIPGEAQPGRGSIFFKCLCAASEIPSPSQANHSICAFRSLKIHGILPALGMASAVHPAARTGTQVPTLHPSVKGCGVFGMSVAGVQVGSWPECGRWWGGW